MGTSSCVLGEIFMRISSLCNFFSNIFEFFLNAFFKMNRYSRLTNVIWNLYSRHISFRHTSMNCSLFAISTILYFTIILICFLFIPNALCRKLSNHVSISISHHLSKPLLFDTSICRKYKFRMKNSVFETLAPTLRVRWILFSPISRNIDTVMLFL